MIAIGWSTEIWHGTACNPLAGRGCDQTSDRSKTTTVGAQSTTHPTNSSIRVLLPPLTKPGSVQDPGFFVVEPLGQPAAQTGLLPRAREHFLRRPAKESGNR